MRTWLELAGITEGAVFRSFALPRGRMRSGELQDRRIDGRDVARLVQRWRGVATSREILAPIVYAPASSPRLRRRRSPKVDIQRVTGHRSVATLRGYVRAGHALRRSTAADHHGPEMIRARVRGIDRFWDERTFGTDLAACASARALTTLSAGLFRGPDAPIARRVAGRRSLVHRLIPRRPIADPSPQQGTKDARAVVGAARLLHAVG